MPEEKQYQILDRDGFVVGCTWATRVEEMGKGAKFYLGDNVMHATAWFGYRLFIGEEEPHAS